MAGVESKKSFSDVQKLASFNTSLPGIAELLNKMVVKGDTKGKSAERTAFDGSKPAPVSIQDYLIRLCKYGYCSNEVFVCLVIYLGRLRSKTGMVFNSYNIHRLLLTSFVVAAKLRDDTYYSNKYYASIGGVTLSDMNRMEAAFLRCTQWELHVLKAEYDQYFSAMHSASHSSRREEWIRSRAAAAGSDGGVESYGNTAANHHSSSQVQAHDPEDRSNSGYSPSSASPTPSLTTGQSSFHSHHHHHLNNLHQNQTATTVTPSSSTAHYYNTSSAASALRKQF